MVVAKQLIPGYDTKNTSGLPDLLCYKNIHSCCLFKINEAHVIVKIRFYNGLGLLNICFLMPTNKANSKCGWCERAG